MRTSSAYPTYPVGDWWRMNRMEEQSWLTHLRHMQDCFRKFPEVYGSELGDDEEETPEVAGAEIAAKTAMEEGAAPAAQKEEAPAPKKVEKEEAPAPKAEKTEVSAAPKAKKQ